MKPVARLAVITGVAALLVAAVATVGKVGTNLLTDSSAPSVGDRKMLIEVGWDAPNPPFVRSHIAEMEKSPFDGTMINLSAGKTFLNKKAYPDTAFEQDRKALAGVKSKTFDQNFITMWSAREAGWDWFNDADWAAAQSNARNFAKVAASSNSVQGLMLDPEPYGTNPWTYTTELYPNRSFVSVQSKVRERGSAFMKTVQDAKPDIKILMLFGASIVKDQAQGSADLQKAPWALWASFIDGMLSAIGPKVELIDGNEQSYYLTSSSEFDAYRPAKVAARDVISPANQAVYDNRITIGSAVFVDGLLNIYNSPRFFGFYLRNTQERQQFLEHNLFHALRTTDRYTWVYNEHMDWWGTAGKGVKTPAGVDALIRRAKAANQKGAPLSFDAESFIAPARAKYKAKVELDGRVASKQGGTEVGIGGVSMLTEFIFEGRDTACEITKPDGYYQCIVPPHWTGRITPSVKGRTFDPPFFQATDVIEPNYNVNFTAK